MDSKKLEDWPIKIIDGDRSTRYPKRKEMVNEGVLFLSTPSIVEGSIDSSVSNFITQEKFDSISKGRLQDSDIVMTTRGTIGKLAFFKSSSKYPTGLINAQMLILRPDPEVIRPKYLFYLMGSDKYQTQMKSFSSGSAQPQIPITDLKKTAINFPEIETQDAVVEVIDNYTNLIENNNRRIAILEDMAQSLYREWFVNFCYPGHADDTKNSESAEKNGNKPTLIDSPLGPIPEGWEVVDLKSVSKMKYGKMSNKGLRCEAGVPIYSGYKITGYYPEANLEESKVIVVARGVGGTGDVKMSPDRCWLTNLSITIIEDEVLLKKPYLYYQLKFANLRRLDSGTSISQITIADLGNWKIILPPVDIQSQFDSYCSTFWDQIKVLEKKNENLKKQRDMLLPKLISGGIEL